MDMSTNKEEMLPSQGSRIPQRAVGARDIVPVPAPSSSNDGQDQKKEKGQDRTTGALAARRKRGINTTLTLSSEEEDIEAVEDIGPDKPEDVSPSLLSPERKKGKGTTGRSVARRGRGRPPTSGEYVGLAAAKQALIDKEREEMEFRAEKELSEEWSMAMRKRHESAKVVEEEGESTQGATTKHLCGSVDESVKAILQVAKTSGKLKGTYVKILKEAAANITEAVGSLRAMSVSEETSRLEKEIARLDKEIKTLREERDRGGNRSVRADQDAARRDPLPVLRRKEPRQDTSETIDPPMEEEEGVIPTPRPTRRGMMSHVEPTLPGRNDGDIIQEVIKQVGQMMDARFAALESRLLPERSLRPPLGSDGRKDNSGRTPLGPGGSSAEETAPAVEVGEWVKVVKRGRGKKPAPPAQPPAGAKAPKPKSAVAPKPKPKARAKRQPQATATAEGQPQQRAGGTGGRALRKIRPPKTAAVVLTLEQPPGQEERMEIAEGETLPQKKSLGEILASVKNQVSLEEIGVGTLRPRRAATGALVLEVPGPESSAGADKLAARLREVLEGKGVRVARPIKTEDLRVSGLDESVSRAEVEAAVMAATGCRGWDLKVAEIQRSPSGLGTAWMRCPSVHAKKLADAGRLTVGWVAARVEALQPRALHCFRCLEKGHTRSQCKAAVDRSGRCYRCGQEGHTARGCTSKARCPLCADLGKPAEHRFGGQVCLSSAGSAGQRKKKGPADKPPDNRKGRTVPPSAPPADKTRGASPKSVQGSRSGSPYIRGGGNRDSEVMGSPRFFGNLRTEGNKEVEEDLTDVLSDDTEMDDGDDGDSIDSLE